MAYFITASTSASVTQTTFDTTGSIVTSSLFTPNDPLNVDNITTIKKSRSPYPNLSRPIYKESVSFTNCAGIAVDWLYDNTASRDSDFNLIKTLNTNYNPSGGGGGSWVGTAKSNLDMATYTIYGVANITASGNISSSGTITALTGSFGTITGLSPITVADSITFQQPITASIISASTFTGDGSGLTNVATSSDVNVYLNFEEATSYAYIIPYSLQFAGFTTSSAMTVQISSSGAPYVFTSSLAQFAVLSVTSSAAGLITLSGSKL